MLLNSEQKQLVQEIIGDLQVNREVYIGEDDKDSQNEIKRYDTKIDLLNKLINQ